MLELKDYFINIDSQSSYIFSVNLFPESIFCKGFQNIIILSLRIEEHAYKRKIVRKSGRNTKKRIDPL